MSMIRPILVVAVVLASVPMPIGAQPVPEAPPAAAEPMSDQDLRLLLETIRSNRKALVSVNLGLTEAEAAKFWPLYDQYQGEMQAFGERTAKLVETYINRFSALTDAEALELIKEYLDIERDRTALRRKYVDQFAEVLPGRKVARFYQIENKVDAVIRYDLAATIPVVETGSPPAAK